MGSTSPTPPILKMFEKFKPGDLYKISDLTELYNDLIFYLPLDYPENIGDILLFLNFYFEKNNIYGNFLFNGKIIDFGPELYILEKIG